MVRIFPKPNIHTIKAAGSKAYIESTLFPVLPVEGLLPEIDRYHYLNKVREITALPDDYFEVIYDDLIDNFAVFVQVLPEIYGEELGGLLNDGLRRALLAIQILHETQETKPHPLFVFTVFSIALLSDIGQIFNYRVFMSDDNGGAIAEWLPCLGAMNNFGEHFKLRPYEGVSASLVRNVTPLLARQLLNETAMTWLSSNDQMFDIWLAFLNKNEDWLGGLGKILKIEKRQFEQRKNSIDVFPVDVQLLEAMDTDLAEHFLDWLKKGLKDGSITYNEANSKVHVIKSNALDVGVFLQAPELFQQFMNVYAKNQSWVVACKQFNHLGLTQLSGNDLKIQQFFSETTEAKSSKLGFLDKQGKQGLTGKEQAVLSSRALTSAANFKEGIVVSNAKVLFGAKVPPVSQFLKNIEMKWGLDSVLPKIHRQVAINPKVPRTDLKI